MPRISVYKLLKWPAKLAHLWLKNRGARAKDTQFVEGVVRAKVDDTHLEVFLPHLGRAVALPVDYSTCDAVAFEVGDYCLVFAPQCDTAKFEVIGFTRETRRCLVIDALVFALQGAPVPPADPNGPQPGNVRQYIRSDRVVFTAPVPINGQLVGQGVTVYALASAIALVEEKDGLERDPAAGPGWLHADNRLGNTAIVNAQGPFTCNSWRIVPGLGASPYMWEQTLLNTIGIPVGQGPDHVWKNFALVPTNPVSNGDPDYNPATGSWEGGHSPISGGVKTSGALGTSTDPFYTGRISSAPRRVARVGLSWTGNSLNADTGLVAIEGTLGGSSSPGVLLIALETGTRTLLWSAEAHVFDVETTDVQYATFAAYRGLTWGYPEASNPFADVVGGNIPRSFDRGPYLNNPSGSFELSTPPVARNTPAPLLNPSYPMSDPNDTRNPNHSVWLDIGGPNPQLAPLPGWGYAAAPVVTPWHRWAHTSRIREELISGPPSPVVQMKAAGESYVLVPAVLRDCTHAIDITPSGFQLGVGSWSSLPKTRSIDFQGETERRQRLYSVRVETQQATLTQNDDVAATKYSSFTNTWVASPAIKAVESRSRWRGRMYHGPGYTIAPWWNRFYRVSGYTSISGSGGAQETAPSIPFVAPGGDRPLVDSLAWLNEPHTPSWVIANDDILVTHYNDGYTFTRPYGNRPNAAGNWVLMDKDNLGSVACWMFKWRASGSAYNGQGYLSDFNGDYTDDSGNNTNPNYTGSGDYPQDPPKQPIAHGDEFNVYSAKYGVIIQQVVRGVLTNPGSYITHPTITPDGKRAVFTAHGVFAFLGGLGYRFCAGLYLLDMSDQTAWKLTLLSPVELRVPSGRAITWNDEGFPEPAALATGNEISVGAPDPITVIASPSLQESRVAYWIARRRISFLNRAGTAILAESGAILDISNPSSPSLIKTFLTDQIMAGGNTPSDQSFEGCLRAIFPQVDKQEHHP